MKSVFLQTILVGLVSSQLLTLASLADEKPSQQALPNATKALPAARSNDRRSASIAFRKVASTPETPAKPETHANFIGVHAGLGLSNFSYGSSAGQLISKDYLSILAGVSFEHRFSSYFYLEPELHVLQKGTSIDLGSNIKLTGAATYIELPIFIKVKLMPEKVVTPYLAVGPNLGIKVASYAAVSGTSALSNATVNLTGVDFCADFRGGLDLKASPTIHMFVGAGYELGLINVSSSATASTVSANTRTLLFNAGASFAI